MTDFPSVENTTDFPSVENTADFPSVENKDFEAASTEPLTAEELQEELQDAVNSPLSSAREAIFTIGENMVAKSIAGLSGISAYFTDEDPIEKIAKTEQALSYSPKDEGAQQILATIAKPFEWWTENVARPVGEAVVEDRTDVNFGPNYIPKIHKPVKVKDSPLAATAAHVAVEALPWIFGPKVIKGTSKATYKGVSKISPKSAEYIDRVVNPIKSVVEPVKEAFAPMSTGTTEARIAAKNYANANRGADTVRNEVIQRMDKKFSKNELEAMGRALYQEELAFKANKPTQKGIDSLPVDQQQAVKSLIDRHKPVAEKAVELGILKESSDIYFPRKVAEVLGDEVVAKLERSTGIKLRTTTPHAKKRKYATKEETAAAASEKFGKEMKVIEDVRVLPIVTAELEKAIAGKTLVNEIKTLSHKLDAELVSTGKKEGFFTINHPAMSEWRPRVEKVDGKWTHVKDEFGKPIFEKHPLFIHESMRGPLEAVLKNESGKIANAFMLLKAKSMSMIMFNPLMHGMVIWGKALPYQPIRTLTFRNYIDGRRLLNSQEAEIVVREATKNGLAPIGNQGWMQRMNDIMSTPQLTAGRSWTSKVMGQLGKPLGKQEAFKTAVDKAGHFWHDTLLWEPIRHAQFGMYQNLKKSFIKKGMTEDAAGKLSAHLSNRFAGSVPFEDMGHGVRAAANFMLFSRTFNATNIGIYKDAVKGLPTVIQEQILKSGKELDMKMASGALKNAARATLAKDILAMYIVNSMTQNLFDYMRTGDVGQIAKDYADNYENYVEKTSQNPVNAVLGVPELMAQSINEPGKEHRIYMGKDPYGRGTYLRNPIGKIGEDLEKFAVSPLALATDKLSPTMKFIMGTGMNDKSINKGWDLRVYDKHGGLEKAPENLGNILKFFIETHTPSGFIESVIDSVTGEDPTDVQKYKVAGQLAGFSVSKGAPGGPAMGQVYEVIEKHKEHVSKHMPDVIKQFQLGNNKKAIDIMVNEGDFSRKDIERAIRKIYPTINEGMVRQYMEIADESERKKLNRMFKKFYGND